MPPAEKNAPTWTVVRPSILMVPRLGGVAVPIHPSTVRINAEILIQWYLCNRAEDHTVMIQTPIGWKFHLCDFLNLLTGGLDTSDLLVSGHFRPHLFQLNAISVLHNYVFDSD